MGKRWSDTDLKYVFDNYKTLGNTEMGAAIGRSGGSVKRKLYDFKLTRTPEELRVIRKRISSRSNDGQFKKGRLPHNTKYDGHERVTKDGYIEIRLCAGNYRLKHLHFWELENGPLPANHCLRSVDGNKLNTDPANWRLVTRIENMFLNSKYRPPEEFIPVMVTAAQLDNAIKNRINGTQ